MRFKHRLTLWSEITAAHRYARRGEIKTAVALFALIRTRVLRQAPPDSLERALAENWSERVAERAFYRSLLAKNSGGPDCPKLLILDASSGLPRPDRLDTPFQGAEVTYPWHLRETYQLVSLSQRNVTTADVVTFLAEDSDVARCDAAILHLGLNDCANRIFAHRERVALSLLPKRLRYRIVGFAKRYRRDILARLPARHYVPLDQFQRNLDLIILHLKQAGVGKIILTTIITPPSNRWSATPGVNLNFARYNQVLMTTAARHDTTLFELDRMVLEAGQDMALSPDGMHLSDAGNELYANQLREQLAN